jgi:hypothetical protein
MVDREIESARQHHSALVSEVEAARGKRGAGSRYWSGKGPNALIDAVQPAIDSRTDLSGYYKLASWDAHHVMAPALDAGVIYGGEEVRIQFGPRHPPAEAATFASGVAIYFLRSRWELLSEAFGWGHL